MHFANVFAKRNAFVYQTLKPEPNFQPEVIPVRGGERIRMDPEAGSATGVGEHVSVRVPARRPPAHRYEFQ